LLFGILRRSALLGAAAVTACTSAYEFDADARPGEPAHEDELADTPSSANSAAGVGVVIDQGATGRSRSQDAAVVASAGPEASSDAGVLGPALTCGSPRSSPLRARELRPAQSYDYLALRERTAYVAQAGIDPSAESWSARDFQVISETGSKCALAQGPACEEKLAQHPTQFVSTFCTMACVELSAVTTRGDVVQRWAGVEALRTLLGEVDSADEALLLLSAAGYELKCDDAEAASWRSVADGYEVYAMRPGLACGLTALTRYHMHVSRAGEIRELGTTSLLRQGGGCAAGRKPAGLLSDGRDAHRSRFGDYLARMAHLEAASVIAFERMARELEALGAPRRLIDAALAARADEVRHAEIIGRLALGHRGELVDPEVAPMEPRTLEEVALENAVEGCVRETYGALVGGYQAAHALNRSLRSAMVRIAQDEARHAALSHQVHRWIMPKLSAAARERVRHAQQRAVFELAAEVAARPDIEVASLAGLPGPELGRMLLAELSKTLWRPALQPRRAGTALG
jgi:hypothetical protein